MEIAVEDRQKRLKIDKAGLVDAARSLLSLAKVSVDNLTLILTDDGGIAPINSAAVGHEGATDVITLYYPPIPGEPSEAEIIINAQRAMDQFPENPARELVYYLAHGINHLSGMDDDTPKKRSAMHRRERKWLKKILG